MKPVVVFDLDGVLADFTKGFTDLAAEMGVVKKGWRTESQPEWHFNFYVDKVWAEVDKQPDFWERLEPLVTLEDLSALESLEKVAHIVYMTARSGPENVGEQTKRWIKACGLPSGPVFVGAANKVALLSTLKHQLAGVIDDKPEFLAEMHAEGYPVVARRWQYNQHLVGVPYVTSITEFVDGLELPSTTAVGYKPAGWESFWRLGEVEDV